ncbi:DUF6912 family protein [Lapillicoccus sp.]|uniref:DUF6912 family protein n=1 Tax=Lapillicoccus sp. TaxID=1909287 RepID=UPI0032645786
MQQRIYVPVTRRTLMSLRAGAGLTGTPLLAFAVTEGLRRDNPGADEEQLEYLAFAQAVAAAPGEQRVVAAADVDADIVAIVSEADVPARSSAVRVADSVPLRLLASLHVEESPRAHGSEPGELLWYDATEIDTVVDLLA